MAESIAYRSIIVASQYASWFFGQLLRVRYSVSGNLPAGLFESNSQHCLILASNHKTYLDAWLSTTALNFRHVHTLIPVRILATQDPLGLLKWFMPLIKILYWLAGAIELPPEDQDDRSLPEKLRGLQERSQDRQA
jgi:1-acyl-sn-glycerol-3-phosphate acyltransferase